MDGILERGNIPQNAKLVFEGIRCRIYQWPQKMHDGSTATFEKIVKLPAATVIAVVDGKVLIQEQEQPHRDPFLSFPGGHANSFDEPLEDIAKRELLEETGLKSENWQLLADISHRDFIVFEHNLFVALDCKKVREPNLGTGEKITEKKISPEELRSVINDVRWRSTDIATFLNKSDNFDKLISLLNK